MCPSSKVRKQQSWDSNPETAPHLTRHPCGPLNGPPQPLELTPCHSAPASLGSSHPGPLLPSTHQPVLCACFLLLGPCFPQISVWLATSCPSGPDLIITFSGRTSWLPWLKTALRHPTHTHTSSPSLYHLTWFIVLQNTYPHQTYHFLHLSCSLLSSPPAWRLHEGSGFYLFVHRCISSAYHTIVPGI